MKKSIITLVTILFLYSCKNNIDSNNGLLLSSNLNNTHVQHIELDKGSYRIDCVNYGNVVPLFDYSNVTSRAYIDLFNKVETARVIADVSYENDKGYYFKFRMLAGITRYNEQLNWHELSKDSIIAKVEVVDRDNLKLWWYGFYDTKQQKRVHLESDFNTIGGDNPVTLIRCED